MMKRMYENTHHIHVQTSQRFRKNRCNAFCITWSPYIRLDLRSCVCRGLESLSMFPENHEHGILNQKATEKEEIYVGILSNYIDIYNFFDQIFRILKKISISFANTNCELVLWILEWDQIWKRKLNQWTPSRTNTRINDPSLFKKGIFNDFFLSSSYTHSTVSKIVIRFSPSFSYVQLYLTRTNMQTNASFSLFHKCDYRLILAFVSSSHKFIS